MSSWKFRYSPMVVGTRGIHPRSVVIALRWASKGGHLTTVQWLWTLESPSVESGKECWTMAYRYGHLETAKWLASQVNPGLPTRSMVCQALVSDRVQFVRWFVRLFAEREGRSRGERHLLWMDYFLYHLAIGDMWQRVSR